MQGLSPDCFRRAESWAVGLDMGKQEFEELAMFALNRHVSTGTPFSDPLAYEHDHSDMVAAGWLEEHGERRYTLTSKTLGRLYGMFGGPCARQK